MDSKTVIQRPHITEKSVADAKAHKFTFIVAKTASKNAIKQAVEQTFNVNVIDVATTIVKGRSKRTGMRRNELALSAFKKAIVLLKEGQNIDLFDIKSE